MFRRHLEEEIIRKCGKTMIFSEIEEEEEEEENLEEQGESFESERITEEELPYESILAEKRRKYTAKDEFIYFLYNDLLQYFVTEWDGYYLRKKFISPEVPEKTNENVQIESKGDEEELLENIEKDNFDKSNFSDLTKDKINISYPKLNIKDQQVRLSFVNGNSYIGRVSRKMMEGEGLYKWSHGAQYKGQFEQNKIHGDGILEWHTYRWYEGKFMKGYRHGRGTLMDKDFQLLYIGEWYMGYRHGKGYCRYAKGDSYDGEWLMGKREGVGLYIYSNGARYKGDWKNNLRHGNGIMSWPNGDVYNGEWKYGKMHGYGECIWHSYCNKNLIWPQDISYTGNWYYNMRHGKGLLKLNSIGGTKYFGQWKYNKKHGNGMIIGNNGEIIEGEPLYTKDILAPLYTKKIAKILEPCTTTILKPEQFPSLLYHINRLMKLSLTNKFSAHSVFRGRCYACNKQQSCSCLLHLSFQLSDINMKKNDLNEKWQYEKNQMYDHLTFHMSKIWHVYNIYAKLFYKMESKYSLVMVRLTLWQLWRDCNITTKGLSLIDIDDYIAENESCFVKKLYHPFEKIEIWQFLHILIEVSWRIYYWKNYEVQKNEHWRNGILATCLHEFLMKDIYPNAGNFVGLVPREYYNSLPIYSIYKVYKSINYPPTAQNILIASIKNHTEDANASLVSLVTVIVPEYILDGLNCVTIGERINFLPRGEKPFMQTKMHVMKKWQGNRINDLCLFQELGPAKMVEIMAKVCPLIKDNDRNIILKMNYSLTFLEFYEIILEASKCIIDARKIRRIQNNPSIIDAEFVQSNYSQAKGISIMSPRSNSKETSK